MTILDETIRCTHHDVVGRLKSESDIRAVIARAAHAADRADEELLGSAYHHDGVHDQGSAFCGLGADYARWIAHTATNFDVMMHNVTTTTIKVNGDVAAAQSYLILITASTAEGVFAWSAGRFLDRFERRDGEWRIVYRRYVHDVDLPVPADPVDVSAIGTYVEGVRSLEDPSYALFSAVAASSPWPNPRPAVTGG